jgi:phosphohistidine phosphatase
MKTLLILRHAKSSWKEHGIDDHDRPLNERGRRSAPRVGRWLRARDLVPDGILCSTAERARATAELVSAAIDHQGPMIVEPDAYLADPATLIDLVSALPEEWSRALLVGHNPGLEALVSDLTGAVEPLPTAALAQIELDVDSWAELPGASRPGRLVHVRRPREHD